MDMERDALVMLREDVGTYLALGGSRVLDKARDGLQEVMERRQGNKNCCRLLARDR